MKVETQRYIPTIAGDFVNAKELSRITEIPYRAITFYNSKFNLLPFFKMIETKSRLFKKNESIRILKEFTELAKTKSLKDARVEIGKTEHHKALFELAESHALEMQKRQQAA